MTDESNVIVIDEKWFDFYRKTEKIKKRKCDPDLPPKMTQSKTHIRKLMFLAALGLPQYTPNGDYFDGLVFIEPFIVQQQAKRRSRNRPAGTLEIKPKNVDSDTFQLMVLKVNGLLDAIKAKTTGMNVKIIVQQDNATPHVGKHTREIINMAALNRGLDIYFVNQPAQSPDLNRLDLCLFHSLNKQRELIKRRCNNYEELIETVRQAFVDYSDDRLKRVYGLQFVVYREILKSHGKSGFRIPHTNIRNRQKEDESTTVDYRCPKELVLDARLALASLLHN